MTKRTGSGVEGVWRKGRKEDESAAFVWDRVGFVLRFGGWVKKVSGTKASKIRFVTAF